MFLKYKQALRGLFTAGTSPPITFGEQKKRSVANRGSIPIKPEVLITMRGKTANK